MQIKDTEGVALSGKQGLHQDGPLERPMLAPKGQYGYRGLKSSGLKFLPLISQAKGQSMHKNIFFIKYSFYFAFWRSNHMDLAFYIIILQ